MALLNRLEMLKDMVQEAIDKGATNVEEVHKAIAMIPFEAAERAGLLDDENQEKRELVLQPIGFVYDKIREINKIVGDMASDLFESLEDAKRVDEVMQENEKSAGKADA